MTDSACTRLCPRLRAARGRFAADLEWRLEEQEANVLVPVFVFPQLAFPTFRVGALACEDHGRTPFSGGSQGGKGVRTLLCEAPSGPFRQKVPDPFSALRTAA